MIKPDFNLIPTDLKKLHQWVIWKGAKVPYIACLPHRKANVTNPSTWSTFDDAKIAYFSGRFDGVGFVLNGNGIVGVDLDNCVFDGQPTQQAMDLMERIGCSYIEISPSGTGLRGFGYCNSEPNRKKGIHDGISVELYSSKRFLTVTGCVIKNEPLKTLIGFIKISKELSPTEEKQKSTEVNGSKPKKTENYRNKQKSTESDICHLQYTSVDTIFKQIPKNLFPIKNRQRNDLIFQLARFLKGTIPQATEEELRKIVILWHKKSYPMINTKEFAITWEDFLRAWENVKLPFGQTLEKALEYVDNEPLPEGLERFGYGPMALHLIKVCSALQRLNTSEPFFLSVRKAGELINVHFTDAAKILKVLVRDKIIEEVSKGSGNKASRYRMKID